LESTCLLGLVIEEAAVELLFVETPKEELTHLESTPLVLLVLVCMNFREEIFFGLNEFDLERADLFRCRFDVLAAAAFGSRIGDGREVTDGCGGALVFGVTDDGDRVNLAILGVLLGLIRIEFFPIDCCSCGEAEPFGRT
jgi:hypothetical protein